MAATVWNTASIQLDRNWHAGGGSDQSSKGYDQFSMQMMQSHALKAHIHMCKFAPVSSWQVSDLCWNQICAPCKFALVDAHLNGPNTWPHFFHFYHTFVKNTILKNR